jgi:DNA-binding NtrC family response regulator
MPGMRGSEVASEVLRMHPEARVIVMPGYADRDMQTEEGQMKYTFLQKP